MPKINGTNDHTIKATKALSQIDKVSITGLPKDLLVNIFSFVVNGNAALSKRFSLSNGDLPSVSSIFYALFKDHSNLERIYLSKVIDTETIEKMLSRQSVLKKLGKADDIKHQIEKLKEQISKLEAKKSEINVPSDDLKQHSIKSQVLFNTEFDLDNLKRELELLIESNATKELLEYRKLYHDAIRKDFHSKMINVESSKELNRWLNELTPTYKDLLYEKHLEDILKMHIEICDKNDFRLKSLISWLSKEPEEIRLKINEIDPSTLDNKHCVYEIISLLPGIQTILDDTQRYNDFILDFAQFRQAYERFSLADNYDLARASIENESPEIKDILDESLYNCLRRELIKFTFDNTTNHISSIKCDIRYLADEEELIIDFQKLSISQIKNLAKIFPNIREITIENLKIDDNQLVEILRNFPNLAKIIINNSELVGNSFLEEVYENHDNLRSISLNGKCQYLNSDDFVKFLQEMKKKGKELQHFQLDDNFECSDELYRAQSEHFELLSNLSMLDPGYRDFLKRTLTDDQLAEMFRNGSWTNVFGPVFNYDSQGKTIVYLDDFQLITTAIKTSDEIPEDVVIIKRTFFERCLKDTVMNYLDIPVAKFSILVFIAGISTKFLMNYNSENTEELSLV